MASPWQEVSLMLKLGGSCETAIAQSEVQGCWEQALTILGQAGPEHPQHQRWGRHNVFEMAAVAQCWEWPFEGYLPLVCICSCASQSLFSQCALCCISAAFTFLLSSNLEAKAAPWCLNHGDVGMWGAWLSLQGLLPSFSTCLLSCKCSFKSDLQHFGPV